MLPRLSVSMAAAPLLELPQVLKVLQNAGVEMLHFDIEDGVFVPGITLGMKIIEELRPYSPLKFDVHLMVANPEAYIPALVGIEVERISVHWEACRYPLRTLGMIRAGGALAGLAFNPATPLPQLEYCLSVLDFVDVLSTEPTLNQSRFIPQALEKLAAGRRRYAGTPLEWEMDGGIEDDNFRSALQAGADVLVIGRAVFRGGTPEENLKRFLQPAP